MTPAKKIREQARDSQADAAVLADVSLTSVARKIRKEAGFSQAEAAVLADCSLTTWRIFEVSPNALTPQKRADCQRALAVIRAKIEARS